MARNDGIDGYGLTLMTDNYKDGIMTGHLGDASPYGAGLFVDVKKGLTNVKKECYYLDNTTKI